MKRAAGKATTLDQRDKERIKNIRSFIMSNLEKELSIKAIAGSFSMSKTTLRRHFLALYHIPIHQFILRCRMLLAKKLIANNECSLHKIPGKTGYKSYASFRKAFIKYFKMSPYRMQQQS